MLIIYQTFQSFPYCLSRILNFLTFYLPLLKKNKYFLPKHPLLTAPLGPLPTRKFGQKSSPVEKITSIFVPTENYNTLKSHCKTSVYFLHPHWFLSSKNNKIQILIHKKPEDFYPHRGLVINFYPHWLEKSHRVCEKGVCVWLECNFKLTTSHETQCFQKLKCEIFSVKLKKISKPFRAWECNQKVPRHWQIPSP